MPSKIEYSVYWNPDSRWNHHHWDVTMCHMGTRSTQSYTYLSKAIEWPLKMRDKNPDHIIVILPTAQVKEAARQYYGKILEEMFNVTEGKFIGC